LARVAFHKVETLIGEVDISRAVSLQVHSDMYMPKIIETERGLTELLRK